MNNLKSIGVPAIDGLATRIWTARGAWENIMPIKKISDKKSKASLDSKGKDQRDASFPIIGIGASAGGLEAFEQFFRFMPPDSGMAFVLVSHLDPNHASMLTEILQRITSMPVEEAQDQTPTLPNHVYVIPPNRDMTIFHGVLNVSALEGARGQRMLIDSFFRSLAEDQGERAICVVLSGSGTDGTLGLRTIHGAGGVSFVQDPTTAKYDGMPASAVHSGLATYVLPVEKVPEQLTTYVKTLFKKGIKPEPYAPPVTNALNKIVAVLRTRTGHDFSLYKQNTIRRRIERRMTVHGIDDTSVYARYLQEHAEEVSLLFKELLINVTSFFREPEAFATLKADILPKLFDHKSENFVFRIWVAGCATGEEAYSIAMTFREYMDESKQEFKVQIYSTDIDDDAIAVARAGSYPPNISIDVSPERLKRFFVKEEAGYRVKKEIRGMIVFAIQNVIKDPPFTKLDLVSCRNLLIYLEPELQNRLIPTFHYALKPGGFLFLSPSESIGNHPDIFAPVNKKWKFYVARESINSGVRVMREGLSWTHDQPRSGLNETLKKAKDIDFAELSRKALLQYYAPPSVITDEKGNILFVNGDTGKYLRPAPGQASLNVVEMAREGLQLQLRTAILTAATQKKQLTCAAVPVKTNGGVQGVNVTVRPLADQGSPMGYLIVSFEEVEPQTKGKRSRARPSAKSGESKRAEELEQELLYTKENLQASIEELQTANEELKSANEELQSTNEELQSTNEELETSKEELQSVNEELITVNSELQAKIEQLAGMQNDMKNLLDNTNIGTIFLDDSLAIKRFTREATALYRLVPTDSRRQLSDIKSNVDGEDLVADAQTVLDSLAPIVKEVRTIDHTWYLARILPYRTLDNVIEGVVLTFTDITGIKQAQEAAQSAREYSECIVDTITQPLVIMDDRLEVVSANRSFYSAFHVISQDTVGRHFYEIGERQWDIPSLRELLDNILTHNTTFEKVEVNHDFPIIGHRKMLLNGRRISQSSGKGLLVLLAIEDVTGTPAT
ncbi:MAG: chemotaxis protein CheB [Desulfomonilaceae bacterium]|jgi:two-component system CheB/CheR fusion protein